ncbi:MAG: radical SAM protein [Candidatus Omnitrophica bacterium]|nr:radical SAM protein [Candidatus Omnitrophota bacterium]
MLRKINTYLGRYQYLRRKRSLKNRPIVWFIELTNYCNLDCPLCPRKFMEREVGYMDPGLFRKIIRQTRKYAFADTVRLHLFGESTFHPDIAEYINFCADNGLKPFLSTNATILNEKMAGEILSSGLSHIILCIDGVTRETYEKIRKGSSFEKTRDNIAQFLMMKKDKGNKDLYTEVQMLETEDTKGEIERFRKEWGPLADRIKIKPLSTWGDKIGKSANKRERHACENFWTRGGFLCNGDFVFCCMDYDGFTSAGNIRDKSLPEIWNSVKAMDLRTEQITGEYNYLCRDCDQWIGEKEDMGYPFSRILKSRRKSEENKRCDLLL